MLGDTSKVAFLMQAFDRGLPLPEERLEMLFNLGTPAAEVGVSELADEAQVCNCNGVTKGALVACVESGVKSVAGVMDKTRAGKGCGSCKTMVCQIVEWAAGGAVVVDPSANWYVPGIPMDKPELMTAIVEQGLRSVSSVFAALAPDGAEDAKSKMGLASLLKMMWADDYIDEKDARFINDRVHANIQKDGTFSVVPQMKGGVTTPAQLRKIADVAEKWDVPMVKLTGGQRIDLLGIKKEDLPGVWADLGMPSGYAYGKSFRTVKTCVGSEFCRFGVGDSTALGIKIESRFQGLESPAKIKMAVTGCPRNCAESLCKDVGVVAIDGGRWEIYIGGAAGAHIRKGDLLATVDDPDLVVTLSGRFMQYYRENAKWLERTYAFVPRVGADFLREVIVEDSLGIAADLDARMQDVDRQLQGPLAGGRGAGHPRPVPHRPPAGGPARRCRSDDRRHRDSAGETAVRLGPLEQIPVGEGRAFGVDGQQVAIFRLRSGAVHAVSAVCPHKGGPIADGQIDGSIVLCPLHMNAFELSTGCSTTGQEPLTSWQVEVDDAGEIVLHVTRADSPVISRP